MYGCETWKINKGNEKRIDVFQDNSLRRILKIKCQDRTTTSEILRLSSMRPLNQEIKYRRWKVIGHILRKYHNNDCKIALSWTFEGRRKRGRPKTMWRRITVEEREEIGWRSWAEARVAAAIKDGWRRSVDALCATRHEADSRRFRRRLSFFPPRF
jgi:hypothetical protein